MALDRLVFAESSLAGLELPDPDVDDEDDDDESFDDDNKNWDDEEDEDEGDEEDEEEEVWQVGKVSLLLDFLESTCLHWPRSSSAQR